MENGRTWGVLAACLAFMLAAAGAGLVLFHTVQGPPGSTWNDYRVTPRGLTVGVAAEGCSEVVGAEVAERGGHVQVTLVVERDLPWYGYCAARSVAERVQVDLTSPLGDRQVVDGACLAERQRRAACVREEREVADRSGVAVGTGTD